MRLLNLNSLSKSFGERLLFSDVSFEVHSGDRIGLIGANGIGKTTLFRIITGAQPADSGSVSVSRETRLGSMEQHIAQSGGVNALGEVLSVFSALQKTEIELAQINLKLEHGSGSTHELIEQQNILNEQYVANGGLTYKSRARAALLGLGFTDDEMNLPISALSGGQRSKVSLARLLVSDANLLLLDEPTNHLDIKSVEWLESFLADYRGAAIIISHDRYFLDRVTTRTAELEHMRVTLTDGGYSRHLELKELERQTALHHYENSIKEIKRLEQMIKRQHQWNREKSVRTAESKQKMLDRLRANLEIPEAQTEGFSFNFAPARRSGNDVLFCRGISAVFPDKTLFTNVSLDIKRGQTVFLVGENGCGKTTLLKKLLSGGEGVSFGASVDVGYYDQALQNLDNGKTVISEIWDTYPSLTETYVRSSLAAFLFYGDDVFKPISSLSGGERARVSLLKLMLSGANLLLLDEPTNHLDIYAMDALEDALTAFEGTLLIVSHDRYFINRLADRIYRLTPDGAEIFEGNFDYYLEHSTREAEAAAKKAKKDTPNEYKQNKEQAAEKRRNKSRLKRLEQQIEAAEQELAETESAISDPENAADYQVISELTAKQAEQTACLEALIDEWSRLAEEVGE